MRHIIFILSCVTALFAAAQRPLPVTGSWLNLFYQDERNKYTNPEAVDNTDPDLWRAKIDQMHRMGIEYVVLMAVANDGKADYPSGIMPLAYPADRKSPVDAILDRAADNGMKVFLSIGWAENQDDNLKRPEILNRQLEIMDELAALYGGHEAMYGWYLPVEDCLGPVLPESSVKAVNRLVDKARKLTPGKKTMISPYGFFCSDFDNPLFAERIGRLKVDIIAYQDEVGCVREEFPLPRLRENWKKIKAIHDRTGIELWANCELFTWEKDLNSRKSALIPAAQGRITGQLQAATDGGVSRIISFASCGIFDDGSDNYTLGQPGISVDAYNEYRRWLKGDEKYLLLEQSMSGKLANRAKDASKPLFDGVYGDENPSNKAWQKLASGNTDFELDTKGCSRVFLRFLDCRKKGVRLPYKVALSVPDENGNYRLVAIKDIPHYPNDLHDTWIEGIVLTIPESDKARISILCDGTTLLDEITLLQ